MKTKFKRTLCALLAVLILMPLLSGCAKQEESTSAITSVHQFTTERVGVQSSTLYEEGLWEICPNVEIAYFTSPTDMLVALEQGKIDSFLIEDISYKIKKDEFSWLKLLDGAVLSTPIGAAISEHSEHPMLQAHLEEFVANMATNGVAEDLDRYWLSEFDPDSCVVDRSGITGENGIVAFAVENAYVPFTYYGHGELQGYDIDFVYRFCRAYGYEPEFYCVEYDAIPVGISTGKFDVGMSVIISEERSENVLFVGPYLNLEIFAAVKGDTVVERDFFASLARSFEQTFIKEDRWKLFLEGTATTLTITVLSALFGTFLGFLLYMLCRKSSLFNKVNGFVNWLISGMPTVLLLMVLYYLIFVDWADIGGIWVAIIGFSLLFGYTIFDILTTSISAIGKGQEEGARALGYNKNQAFFHVILPQALRIAFPQLKSAITGLIKETSIVGYISVADLTRMSDIVRGRTYEAFFPLVTSTIIYFILIWLILFVIKRIEIEMTFRPIRIEKIKKGIKIK